MAAISLKHYNHASEVVITSISRPDIIICMNIEDDYLWFYYKAESYICCSKILFCPSNS
jgi:hypothetical protein